jgi:tetratricopeptide (TPR) repeat protein
LAYIFRHTLVQETAYETLLHKSRRELHGQVARCYEQLYADSLEAHATLLVHHFARAGDQPDLTFRYALMAGDVAFEHNANAEAIGHYDTALGLILAGDLSLSSEQVSGYLVHLHTRRRRALELSGKYDQAVAIYVAMRDLGLRHGDRALELAGLMAEATARAAPTTVQDLGLAQELCDRALALAGELGNSVAAAKILWTLLLISTFLGQPHDAVLYGEQAVALARELGLHEQLAYALNDIHRPYYALGEIELARAALEEAEALWRELGNEPMLADNLNSAGEFFLCIGEHDRALRSAEEAGRLSEAIGNRWGIAYSRMAHSVVLAERGQAAAAIGCLAESIRLAEMVGFVHPQVVGRLMLSMLYHDLGAARRAQQQLDEAIAVAEHQLVPVVPLLLTVRDWQRLLEGETVAARDPARGGPEGAILDGRTLLLHSLGAAIIWLPEAEILLSQGQGLHALNLVERLLADMARFQLRPYRVDVLFVRARALLALDQREDAWVALQAARQEAEALSSRRVLWRILAATADLAGERGDREAVARLRVEAQAVVGYIADHTGSEDLRSTFLSQPAVRAILASAELESGVAPRQNST